MNIAVTGLNATDNPAPGVPVMRSVQYGTQTGHKLIGLVYDPLEPGIYIDGLAHACYQIPYPSSSLDALFERIVAIHERERIDILIPNLDSELYGFVKLQEKLRAIGIRMFLPTVEQLNIRGKDKLFDFCSANGIRVPKNTLLTSARHFAACADSITYPVVVKGIFYEAVIARGYEEARSAFNALSSSLRLTTMVTFNSDEPWAMARTFTPFLPSA